MEDHVAPGATVYTDDATAYESLPFTHATVKHSLSEYVKGDVHNEWDRVVVVDAQAGAQGHVPQALAEAP